MSIAIETHAGAKNTLQVKMNGSHFTLAINGEQVAQADDAEFAAGAVGLTGYTELKVVYTDSLSRRRDDQREQGLSRRPPLGACLPRAPTLPRASVY